MACIHCGKEGVELRWGFCRECRPDLHKDEYKPQELAEYSPEIEARIKKNLAPRDSSR